MLGTGKGIVIASLFVAQRFNRVQVRSPDHRKHPAGHTDQGENRGSDEQNLGRDDQANVAHLGMLGVAAIESQGSDRERDQIRKQYPGDPSDGRNDQGLAA